MLGRTHYETLGISKGATQEEIKAAFRKLSLETHPDLKKDTSCGETFKKIANAHSILSNPKERRHYDRQLQENAMWRGSGGFSGHHHETDRFYGGGSFHHHGYSRPPKPAMHVVMNTLSNPRYIVWCVAGFGGMAIVGAMLGGISSSRPEYHYHEPLVEAWKNPKSGYWEQPAPWDPDYQKLQPKLEMVPRGIVRRRNI
jgi:curved DNA-binding protein CbpA